MKKSSVWLVAIVLFAVLFISQEKSTSFLTPIFGDVISKVILVSIAVLLFLSEPIVEFFIARREEKIKRERIARAGNASICKGCVVFSVVLSRA